MINFKVLEMIKSFVTSSNKLKHNLTTTAYDFHTAGFKR